MQQLGKAAAIGVLGSAVLVGTTGCVVAIGNGGWESDGPQVSRSQLSSLVDINRGVKLGDSKDAVLAKEGLGEHASLFSSQEFDGRTVEEWRVRARNNSRVFQRWYYFVDGNLAAFGDDRIEYTASTVSRWSE